MAVPVIPASFLYKRNKFWKEMVASVIEVPSNKPLVRKDHTDRIYKTEAGKFKAIVREVKEMHKKGQPVLLGTVSIEKNEALSAMLKAADVPHEMLNAKNNEG